MVDVSSPAADPDGGAGDAGASRGGAPRGRDRPWRAWTARPLARRVPALLLALAVAVLVVAAALLGERDTPALDEAADRIRGLYASQDVDGTLEAVAPGSVGRGQTRNLAAALERVLAAEDVTVEDQSVVHVSGVAVARIRTSDGLAWCVRPDGHLLLGCRLGELPVTAEVRALPLQVPFAAGDLYDDQAEVAVLLTSSGGTVTLPGRLRVTTPEGGPAPAELVETSYIRGGQAQPAPEVDVQLPPDRGLLVRLRASSPAARDALLRTDLVLRWQEGAVTLITGRPEWFLR